MRRREFFALGAAVGTGYFVAHTEATAAEKEGQAEEQRLQIYKCEECGTIVEVLEPGSAPLKHCGKNMKLLVESTTGTIAPKHAPVIEKVEGGYKVKVGEVAHPMTKEHHIAWIDLIADGKVYRRFLPVDQPPEAVFPFEGQKVAARAYCNLHGLWRKA